MITVISFSTSSYTDVFASFCIQTWSGHLCCTSQLKRAKLKALVLWGFSRYIEIQFSNTFTSETKSAHLKTAYAEYALDKILLKVYTAERSSTKEELKIACCYAIFPKRKVIPVYAASNT